MDKDNSTINKDKDKIQVECTILNVRFYKNGWGIINTSIDKVIKGELLTDPKSTVFKGEMPTVKEGEAYKVSGTYVHDAKWGDQYNIDMIASNITLDDSDDASKRKFLLSIFTEKQVDNMYAALKDPYMTLKNEDAVSLVQVRGCGLHNTQAWILRFQQNYHRARIYSELDEYNLSSSIIDKLIERYNSPDMVIEKIKNNPYVLVTEVKGIGWAIADKIALAGGLGEYSVERISAYIYQYLHDVGEDGFSWVTTDELMGTILEKFGEDVPDSSVTEAVHFMEDKLWWSEDKTRIGLKRYFYYENNVATELLRLRDAENKCLYSDWEDAIHRIEYLQGWEYTDEQMSAIKKALDTNVILIQGGAGTGKSSVVRAILAALSHCSFVQCALSGKAASRLMEVTEKEGFTIHRLLGFPSNDENSKQSFLYHDENQLRYDVYILDEISMVDIELFYYLLRAIPSGSKLICLGDNGQLEAIGSGNIAYDMLVSPEIESVTLNKIHRQAADSAIVTESIKIRKGIQIVEKDWVGHEVRGNLKDFEIIAYSDRSNTYYKIMEYYSKVYEECKDVRLIQVIVPTKQKGTSTYILNNAIQELCNPKGKEIYISIGKDKGYFIRVGDKVVNVINNYKVYPNIFNGNTGIVKYIGYDENDEMVIIIDFEGIGEVKLIEKYWKGIELAYAMTCHKCQGSECENVIFGLDFNAFTLLSKELVYTGITRAKKKCYLICETNALRYATGKSSVRVKQTHLQQCLHDIAHPKIIF